MSWDQVCTPKAAGGLNLIKLKLWNKAVVAKSCWNLANKQVGLWIRWLHSYYIKGQHIEDMRVPTQACWMIQKIFNARVHTSSYIPISPVREEEYDQKNVSPSDRGPA